MTRSLIAYVAAGLAMLILDSVWLTTTYDRLYRPRIGELMAPQFSLAPAICFYLLYLVGILVLAIWPALAEGSLTGAAWRGAMLGLIAYGTYDLTNQATLRGWSTLITVADIGWGTFLTAVVASAGYLAATRWG